MKKLLTYFLFLITISLSAQTNCENNLSINIKANYKNCLGSDMFYQVSVLNHTSGTGIISVNASLPQGVQIIDAKTSFGSYDYITGIWNNIQFTDNNQSAQLLIRCRINELNVNSFNASINAGSMNNCNSNDDNFLFNAIEITKCDKDADGILDYNDVDDDNDGLHDEVEYIGYITPTSNLLHAAGLTIYNSSEETIKTNQVNQNQINQSAFPGDASKNVTTNQDWILVSNKNSSNSNIVWEQTISNVREKVAYLFVFYTSSAQNPGIASNNTAQLNIFQDGVSQFSGIQLSDEFTTFNGTDTWERHELQIIPDYGKTSVTISIANDALISDAFAMSGFSLTEMPYASIGGDPLEDTDGDGVANYLDENFCDLNSKNVTKCLDFDGDGIINSFDLDSDNDGLPDLAEVMGDDLNGDGVVDLLDYEDLNSNGWADKYDNTANGSLLTLKDADGDGVNNLNDLDSDNDGIADLVEQGGKDTNGDGLVDNQQDLNANGLMDIYDPNAMAISLGALIKTQPNNNNINISYKQGDCDGDGVINAYDLDADGDGIYDIAESNTIDADNNGAPDPSFVDNDNNGWNDLFDVLSGGTAINTQDFDNDGQADFIDKDADNDGIRDAVEAVDNITKEDTIVVLGADGSNQVKMVSVVANYDRGDKPDYLDLDTDNDKIPDWKEGYTNPYKWNDEIKSLKNKVAANNAAFAIYDETDVDQNNVVDWLDITSSGKPALLDGQNNYFLDENKDGFNDLFDVLLGGFEAPIIDLNKNNKPDYRDAQGIDGGGNLGGDISLPLQLLSFNAEKIKNSHNIFWSTANELQVASFDIELSVDAQEFKSIGNVSSNSSFSTLNNYNFINENISSDKVYYRLKMIDNIGTYTYSNIISLSSDLNNQIGFKLSQLGNSINYSIFNQQQTTNSNIKLYDLGGKQIINKDLNSSTGSLTLDNIASGIYVYSYTNADQNLSGKIYIAK